MIGVVSSHLQVGHTNGMNRWSCLLSSSNSSLFVALESAIPSEVIGLLLQHDLALPLAVVVWQLFIVFAVDNIATCRLRRGSPPLEILVDIVCHIADVSTP